MFERFAVRWQYTAVFLLVLGFSLALSAQTRTRPAQHKPPHAQIPSPNAYTPGSADTQVGQIVNEISKDRIKANIEKLVGFGTRLTLSAQDPNSIVAGRGIGAAREWIKSEFERYSIECKGCLDVKTDTLTEQPSDRIPTPTEITNVFAVMKGTDPEGSKRILLVTGHYDSRNSDTLDTKGDAPGANDDASGTAVSLECARVLSKHKFPATIIFLAVAGEEQGLNGSKHFAQMAKQLGWNIEAVLNNDIVGGNLNALQDPDTVRVFSEGLPGAATPEQIQVLRALGSESDSPSRQLARYIADVSRIYPGGLRPVLIFRPDRFLRGGDHLAFNHEGFAAVRLTEYREDYNHQHQNVRTEGGVEYGDLPKFVNFDYVGHVAALNATTLASLASAPAPPASVRVLTKNLENDTTLTWDTAPDRRASEFEVLWRATNVNDWQGVEHVGKVNRVTLPFSKDNLIFAVRAVDIQGRRSLPVLPSPER